MTNPCSLWSAAKERNDTKAMEAIIDEWDYRDMRGLCTFMANVSDDIVAFLPDVDVCSIALFTIKQKLSDCMAIMLSKGMQPNRKVYGHTYLHEIAVRMHLDAENAYRLAPMLTLLIAAGADQTLTDTGGLTARQVFDVAQDTFQYGFALHGLTLQLPVDIENQDRIDLEALWDHACSKEAVEQVSFSYIKTRALTVCIAMQELALPAWCTMRIILHVGEPFSRAARLHHVWQLVTKVKHFKC